MVSRKPRAGTGKRSSAGRKKRATRRTTTPRRNLPRKATLATAPAGPRTTADEEE